MILDKISVTLTPHTDLSTPDDPMVDMRIEAQMGGNKYPVSKLVPMDGPYLDSIYAIATQELLIVLKSFLPETSEK